MPLALVGVGRLFGVGPERMVEIGRTLGITTAEDAEDRTDSAVPR